MSTIVVFSMVLLQESTSTSASSEVETRQVRGADEVGRGEAGAQEGGVHTPSTEQEEGVGVGGRVSFHFTTSNIKES